MNSNLDDKVSITKFSTDTWNALSNIKEIDKYLCIIGSSYIDNFMSYGVTIRIGGSSLDNYVDDTYWLSWDHEGHFGIGAQCNGAKYPTWTKK